MQWTRGNFGAGRERAQERETLVELVPKGRPESGGRGGEWETLVGLAPIGRPESGGLFEFVMSC